MKAVSREFSGASSFLTCLPKLDEATASALSPEDTLVSTNASLFFLLSVCKIIASIARKPNANCSVGNAAPSISLDTDVMPSALVICLPKSSAKDILGMPTELYVSLAAPDT